MRLWNTLTRRKQTVRPANAVLLYVCGITPYDTTHLGHARTYLVFDVLVRELERLGHEVRYVQNVTDVDDPLIARAREVGRPPAEVAAEFTNLFRWDMAALGARPPDAFPRASDEIPSMQRTIGMLVERRHAYVADGWVYFRRRSFPRYGRLSRLSSDEMVRVAAERGEDPSDPRKEDPLDFVLWRPSDISEPAWPSPWGNGRPGWHIECTTMATRLLGPRIDIHGGGSDLIYPHHENEIAQSESATGEAPFARIWMHVGMVRLGGIKMSKSLGNLVLVGDLLQRFGPGAIRHYLLRTHYRDMLDYSVAGLEASARLMAHLGDLFQQGPLPESPASGSSVAAGRALRRSFDAALADDLDTATALEVIDAGMQQLLALPRERRSAEDVRTIQELVARLGLASFPTREAR